MMDNSKAVTKNEDIERYLEAAGLVCACEKCRTRRLNNLKKV